MSENPKFPVRGVGQGWNDGLIADATIELRSSGLVGTAYGFPGISATLIGTGLYDIRFPVAAERGVRIYPEAVPGAVSGTAVPPTVPTGALPQFGVNMHRVSGQSGSAYLSTTTVSPTPSAVGAATGLRHINAPTNSVINLQFLVSPITRY